MYVHTYQEEVKESSVGVDQLGVSITNTQHFFQLCSERGRESQITSMSHAPVTMSHASHLKPLNNKWLPDNTHKMECVLAGTHRMASWLLGSHKL